MDTHDEASNEVEGRVTRARRRRLVSIDSEASSRPSTPLPIVKTEVEALPKRVTRRNSITQTPKKTPSKAKDISIIDLSTPTKSSRRLSVETGTPKKLINRQTPLKSLPEEKENTKNKKVGKSKAALETSAKGTRGRPRRVAQYEPHSDDDDVETIDLSLNDEDIKPNIEELNVPATETVEGQEDSNTNSDKSPIKVKLTNENLDTPSEADSQENNNNNNYETPSKIENLKDLQDNDEKKIRRSIVRLERLRSESLERNEAEDDSNQGENNDGKNIEETENANKFADAPIEADSTDINKSLKEANPSTDNENPNASDAKIISVLVIPPNENNTENTKTPEKIESPQKTKTPQRTQSPLKTKTPQKIESPQKTKTPQKTQSPLKTKTPEKIESPQKTKTPQRTQSPLKTKTPEKIELPQKTKTPQKTQSPLKTKTPQKTESPQKTETTPKIESPQKPTPQKTRTPQTEENDVNVSYLSKSPNEQSKSMHSKSVSFDCGDHLNVSKISFPKTPAPRKSSIPRMFRTLDDATERLMNKEKLLRFATIHSESGGEVHEANESSLENSASFKIDGDEENDEMDKPTETINSNEPDKSMINGFSEEEANNSKDSETEKVETPQEAVGGNAIKTEKKDESVDEIEEEEEEENRIIDDSNENLAIENGNDDSNEEKDSEDKEGENLYPRTWMQSVKRSSIKIDTLEPTNEDSPRKAAKEVEKKEENFDFKLQLREDSSNDSDFEKQSDEDDDQEREREHNDFVNDEAMDMGDSYQSGDSMTQEEREDAAENLEIDDGESIGSKDTTEDEAEDDCPDENNSFIVTSDEDEEIKMLEYSDDDEHLKESPEKPKTYKRLKKLPSESEDDEGEEAGADADADAKAFTYDVTHMIDDFDEELSEDEKEEVPIKETHNESGKKHRRSMNEQQDMNSDIEEEHSIKGRRSLNTNENRRSRKVSLAEIHEVPEQNVSPNKSEESEENKQENSSQSEENSSKENHCHSEENKAAAQISRLSRRSDFDYKSSKKHADGGVRHRSFDEAKHAILLESSKKRRKSRNISVMESPESNFENNDGNESEANEVELQMENDSDDGDSIEKQNEKHEDLPQNSLSSKKRRESRNISALRENQESNSETGDDDEEEEIETNEEENIEVENRKVAPTLERKHSKSLIEISNSTSFEQLKNPPNRSFAIIQHKHSFIETTEDTASETHSTTKIKLSFDEEAAGEGAAKIQSHRTSTPFHKKGQSNANADADAEEIQSNISKILARCDEMLQSSANAKKSLRDLKPTKERKKKSKPVKDSDEDNAPSTVDDVKLALQQALKASVNILTKRNRKRQREQLEAQDDENKYASKRLPADVLAAVSSNGELPKKRKKTDNSVDAPQIPRKIFKSTCGDLIVESPIAPPKLKKPKVEVIKTSTGEVRVEPITPMPKKANVAGFRESPLTPRATGWKMRQLLQANSGLNQTPVSSTSAAGNVGRKRKRRHPQTVEPNNSLPQPTWTKSAGNFKIDKIEQRMKVFKTANGSTEFGVVALGESNSSVLRKKLLKQAIDGASSLQSAAERAMDFRRNAVYRANIPREDARNLLRRKRLLH